MRQDRWRCSGALGELDKDGDSDGLAQGGAEFEKEEKSGNGTCTQDFQGNLASGWPAIDTAWGPAGPIADLYTVSTTSQCYGGE